MITFTITIVEHAKNAPLAGVSVATQTARDKPTKLEQATLDAVASTFEANMTALVKAHAALGGKAGVVQSEPAMFDDVFQQITGRRLR